jgi:hypothetical protein
MRARAHRIGTAHAFNLVRRKIGRELRRERVDAARVDAFAQRFRRRHRL